MPAFLLVAALSRGTIERSKKRTMEFLESWSSIAPESTKNWIRATIGGTTIGGTTGFVFLIALTLFFDEGGVTSVRAFGDHCYLVTLMYQ